MTTDRELPKIRKALERIADGIERYTDADPLTVLNEALRDVEGESGGSLPQNPLMPEPRGWFASNGDAYLYRMPVEGWHLVLRRDKYSPSGYVASVEEA